MNFTEIGSNVAEQAEAAARATATAGTKAAKQAIKYASKYKDFQEKLINFTESNWKGLWEKISGWGAVAWTTIEYGE